MICKKCGRAIADESEACCFCGNNVVNDETAAEQTGNGSQADNTWTGAPKKQCAVCGKDLPMSTVSDTCALCTMRSRNDDKAAPSSEPASAAPNSQQPAGASFAEQSPAGYTGYSSAPAGANTGTSANYSAGAAGTGNFSGSTQGQTSYQPAASGEVRFTPAPKPQRKWGCLIGGITFGVIMLVAVISVSCALIFEFLASPSTTNGYNAYQSLPDVEEAYYDDSDYDDYTALDQYDMLIKQYPFNEAPITGTETMEELFIEYIAPSVIYAFYGISEEYELTDITFDYDALKWDGAYIYVSGEVVHHTYGPEMTEPYQLVLIMGDTTAYDNLAFTVGDTVYYDRLSIVDKQGRWTAAAISEYGVNVGDPYFADEEVVFLDNHVNN